MLKPPNEHQNGFSALVLLLTVAVFLAAGLAGWYVLGNHKSGKRVQSTTSTAATQTKDNKAAPVEPSAQADPSEGGKYLVIREWHMRVALPQNLQGKVAYKMGEPIVGPDGNQIQAAKVFVASDVVQSAANCTAETTSIGPAIDTAAQFIRSEKGKPFDAARYRWTFKENIASDAQYNYHLNYVALYCFDDPSTVETVNGLHAALINLQLLQ